MRVYEVERGKNNNNYHYDRVLGAAGGGRSKNNVPAISVDTQSGAGEKETRNINVVGKQTHKVKITEHKNNIYIFI